MEDKKEGLAVIKYMKKFEENLKKDWFGTTFISICLITAFGGIHHIVKYGLYWNYLLGAIFSPILTLPFWEIFKSNSIFKKINDYVYKRKVINFIFLFLFIFLPTFLITNMAATKEHEQFKIEMAEKRALERLQEEARKEREREEEEREDVAKAAEDNTKKAYNRYSAPKILYRCNGILMYAYGTGLENYNDIYNQSKSICRDFDLIDYEK